MGHVARVVERRGVYRVTVGQRFPTCAPRSPKGSAAAPGKYCIGGS